MLVQRIFTDGLAQVSFVIASERTGQALVVDPRRDVEVYLEAAAAHGLTLTHITETHIHADYASGARELATRTGAEVLLSRAGHNAFPHTPLNHRDVLRLGEVRVEVLHTPGHTPEHLCFLASDEERPDRPSLLFTGDMLFVGSVGRPDLLGEAQTLALARALYRTVHEVLAPLPDQTVVYPGHGAGSACGKAIGDAESTTLGQERRFNPFFQPMPEEQFVALVLEGLPQAPPYFPVMKRLNHAGPPILGGVPQPPALSLDDLRALQAGERGEVTIVDVRDVEPFSAGFLRGSLNIGLGPSLPAWAGWAVPYDRPIVLVVGDPDDALEAVTHLIRIGLDDVLGYVVANPEAWRAAGLAVERIKLVDPATLQQQLAADGLAMIDVRNPDEWESGHIPGARNLPAGPLAASGNGIEAGRPVAVTCQVGYRSSLAASVLKRHGASEVVNLRGGMDAWRAAGLPVE